MSHLLATARLLATPLLGAALLGACTYQGQNRADSRDRVPPARITGPAVSCIPLSAISNTPVRNGQTIDFMTSSRRGWRNVLPMECPGLARERAFTYSTSLTQLCSTDIIRVLENWGGGPRAAGGCGLGTFTPIELR